MTDKTQYLLELVKHNVKAPIAVNELEALVLETIELVEIHMPQVDTSLSKRKLGWRQQPWKGG